MKSGGTVPDGLGNGERKFRAVIYGAPVAVV